VAAAVRLACLGLRVGTETLVSAAHYPCPNSAAAAVFASARAALCTATCHPAACLHLPRGNAGGFACALRLEPLASSYRLGTVPPARPPQRPGSSLPGYPRSPSVSNAVSCPASVGTAASICRHHELRQQSLARPCGRVPALFWMCCCCSRPLEIMSFVDSPTYTRFREHEYSLVGKLD
jgi:hypothetical protein